MSSEFQEQVYAIVARIPTGKVVTYGQIAAWLDRPRAARQVGYAMAACPRERRLPWHRVINARGEVSRRAHAGDEEYQRLLLEAEGIVFDQRGRVPLATYQWQADA
jgi:methylated-DNA-protein-cysteine methyltransferase-like protein